MVGPKRKTSKQRKRLRRGSVWKLTVPTLVPCESCGALKRPHRICLACGKYKDKDVYPESGEKKAKKA